MTDWIVGRHRRGIAQRALWVLLVFIGVIVQDAHGQAPDAVALQSTWPHDHSDLTPDPDAVFGSLPNGLRYVLRENRTPVDRVSMHLYIQAGSLMEAEHERGIAHFLEHMLFNGSTHFPPGEMVKYFQRIGMQFGPDANASTGFDQTVYDILLPEGGRKSLSDALVVLKDYAQGALLLPGEVAKEKKIVLAEMRTRDSSRFRTLKAVLNYEMPGLMLSRRLPIGEQTSIEKMNAQMLRRFYDAWYRPERMILVLVGDFDSKDAQELIKEQFNDLTARLPGQKVPDLGRMQARGHNYFYHREADTGKTSVTIETVTQTIAPGDSLQNEKSELLQDLAVYMLQRRLEAILQDRGTVLTSASNHSGYFLRQVRYAEIRAECKPEHWQQTIAVLDQALRKALQYGFTTSELFRAKKDFQVQLIQAAKKADTRESSAVARDIIASMSRWKVFQSPGQQLTRMAPVLKTATLKQVNGAFADIWNSPERLVLVTGNADLSSQKMSPPAQIEKVYLASQQQPVSPPTNRKLAVFPYLPVPEAPGKIIEKETDKDLGIEKVVFANGFTLWLKPTRFKKNQVLAALSFGDGSFSEPENQPGLSRWTEAVVNESGFGALDRIALEEALAGRWTGVELNVGEAMFSLAGESVSDELELLIQLLYTAVKDPGYGQDAFQKIYRQFELEGERLPRSVAGMMRLHGQRFLSGGDSRFGIPVWQELKQRTLDQIKLWYGKQLRRAPMELAVVGDFQRDDLVEWVAQYFGSLPKRVRVAQPLTRPGPVFPSGQTLRLTAQTDIPKALLVVSFPTEDFWNIGRTRRLAMTAELFSERLRQHVREKLGAAYSPFAYNRSYRSYSGYGLFQVHVQVDPGQADRIAGEVRRIAEQLADKSIDEDELRRVLDPMLTHIKDLRQTNAYWLNSVLKGVSRYPEQLEWARTFETDYAAITAEELKHLAMKYLDNQKGATLIITPAGQ